MVHNGWGLTLADTAGGLRTIKYAITDSVCGLPDTASKQVYLHSAPIIIWTDSFEVCEGDTAISVNTSTPPATGWGGPINNGWFYPKNGMIGKNTLILIVRDFSTYCNSRAFSHVFIHPKPAMSFKNIPPICENEDTLIFNHAIPLGGQYFGDSFTGESVSPNNLGPGFHKVFYTYQDTIGCRDTIANIFKIDTMPPQPQILLLGSDSITSSLKGDTFKWFWNGTELSNQSNTLVNPQAGNYELIVISGTCESPISASFYYNPLNILEPKQKQFQIFPNPSKGHFTIMVDEQFIGEEVQIFNQLGQVVLKKELTNTQHEFFGLPIGVFVLELADKRQRLIVK